MKQLKYFLVALAALATIGCGSSSNDYVYTGNVNPALTGDVTFQFDQTATQALVPAGTTFLNFDFYSEVDADGNPVPPADFISHNVPYASSVTIEDVPVAASYVVITAYGDHGIPLATAETPITIYGGQNTNADMTDVPVVSVSATSVTATPVTVNVGANATPAVTATFDNGESVTLHSSLFNVAGNDANVASYAAATGFTGVAAGNTTYTATFGSITSAAATITVGTVVPTPTTQLVVSPVGAIATHDEDGAFTIRQFAQAFALSIKVMSGDTVLQDASQTFGYDTTLEQSTSGSFSIDNDGLFHIAPGAGAGDWCNIALHANYGGAELSTNFKVVLGPVAQVSSYLNTAAAGNTISGITFHVDDVDGDRVSDPNLTWAQLLAYSGYSGTTLLSSNPALLTVDNAAGTITVSQTATPGASAVVWLMQGDLIMDAMTITVMVI